MSVLFVLIILIINVDLLFEILLFELICVNIVLYIGKFVDVVGINILVWVIIVMIVNICI